MKNVPVDYIQRTNAALDHILQNLDGDLSLDKVAHVAEFSPHHFHRVFRSLVGETLNQFVKRLRLERAVYLMSHTTNKPLTSVALECGFSSSSDFSRSFKARFQVAPSDFDVQHLRDSRREEFEGILKSFENGPQLDRLPAGENPDGFEAQLRNIPPCTVAYIRVTDPYASAGVVDACGRLVDWAEQRGFADGQWLGYQWDDPEIVAMKDCRYDVAVVIEDDNAEFQSEGEIGRYQFPAMCVAEVPIAGDAHLELRAIDWLFGTWLPRSGYEPDDQPAFEAWDGRPFEHGLEHFELRCQLPIVVTRNTG